MAEITWRSYLFSSYIDPSTKKLVKSNLRDIRLFQTIILTPIIIYFISLIDKIALSQTQWLLYFALFLLLLMILDLIIIRWKIIFVESP
jgi:hypothetical protein